MGDWLAILEPLVSDMSDTSEEWWKIMMGRDHSAVQRPHEPVSTGQGQPQL